MSDIKVEKVYIIVRLRCDGYSDGHPWDTHAYKVVSEDSKCSGYPTEEEAFEEMLWLMENGGSDEYIILSKYRRVWC